jgi:hypothetical protein
VPTFNRPAHDDMSYDDFYSIYGDMYVADIVEGGDFIAVLSIKTRTKSDAMDVQAKLEASFGGVQAKGAGAYNTKELEQMASMDVNVHYSGALGVNPGEFPP